MMRPFFLGLGLAWAAFAQQRTDAAAVLDRYLAHVPTACETSEHAVEMQIDATLPKLEKQGTMYGLKVVSDTGQVAYRFLRFTGDKLIKTDVIARFLTAETQARQQTGDVSISKANYKFKFVRTDAAAYVFELKPRQKRSGLFKGELWLDPSTAEPVREKGEFVKAPSIFVKKIRFVRDYRIAAAACAPPAHTSITVQTRIAGNAEMTVVQRPVSSNWQPPAGEREAGSTAQN